jgi:hypothetical protein
MVCKKTCGKCKGIKGSFKFYSKIFFPSLLAYIKNFPKKIKKFPKIIKKFPTKKFSKKGSIPPKYGNFSQKKKYRPQIVIN